MTDNELKDLVAGLAIAQKETDRQLKETSRELKENGRELKEKSAATDRQLKELGKQLGGLGNKFGSFTEGMAFPSMEKVLRKRFKMNVFATRVKAKKGEEFLEMDALAYANTSVNEVYIVEVKSYLRKEDLSQMLQTLHSFPEFFAEHRNKKLFGILAVVDVRENLKQQVLKAGIYLALIHDDLFEIAVPKNFKPKSFNLG